MFDSCRTCTKRCRRAKYITIMYTLQGSPWGCGWLEIPGVSQVERGNTGVPMYMSVARFTGVVCTSDAVVPLLYCADAFEIQRNCGFDLSLVVFKMVRPHNTHTCT